MGYLRSTEGRVAANSFILNEAAPAHLLVKTEHSRQKNRNTFDSFGRKLRGCAITSIGSRSPLAARFRTALEEHHGNRTVSVYCDVLSRPLQVGHRAVGALRNGRRLRPKLLWHGLRRRSKPQWIRSVSFHQCMEHQHSLGSR